MEIQFRRCIFIPNKRFSTKENVFFSFVQIQFLLKLDDDRDGEDK